MLAKAWLNNLVQVLFVCGGGVVILIVVIIALAFLFGDKTPVPGSRKGD